MPEKEEKLYINRLEIENWSDDFSLGLDDRVIAFDLPEHEVIHKLKVEKYILDMDDEDAEALGALFRGLDTDRLAGKRVRIFIQNMGPVPKQR